MMDSARRYLLQTECDTNYLFCDTSSISYMARVRPFENFLFELSCRLSECPSLTVVHAPGRVLSGPDLLTRQLNDVVFNRDDTNISEHQAHILPILEDKIKPGEIISNQALYEIMLGLILLHQPANSSMSAKKIRHTLNESIGLIMQNLISFLHRKKSSSWLQCLTMMIQCSNSKP
jgi:hypothetical protein